jgi:AAA ATPase domain/Adenylate and Guanylate cyclase catalytic domain
VARGDGVSLAVRIGIASGLVVVGETIGEGAAREQTVVGETPNLAAPLQALAGPDALLISAATRDLVGHIFACEALGAHALKGIAEAVQVWHVTGLREEEDAEIDAAPADFPLVGRDEEIGLLRRAWQQIKAEGHGQVVFVSGEPGIGKTSLVNILRRAAREEGLTRITFRCSPYHTNSALYPFAEHWKHLAGWQPEDDNEARRDKLEEIADALPAAARGDGAAVRAAVVVAARRSLSEARDYAGTIEAAHRGRDCRHGGGRDRAATDAGRVGRCALGRRRRPWISSAS